MTKTVVDKSLIKTCKEGPAVSLNGSPTKKKKNKFLRTFQGEKKE